MIDYFEARASNYGERSESGLWRLTREREFGGIRALLAPSPGQRVIDLGCGAGFYGIRLRERCGVEVLGVDSSPAMVRAAAVHMPALLSSVESIPECGVFDHAVAAGVFEFVESPAKVFLRCRSLIKPGGRLALLIPAMGVAGRAYSWFHERKFCRVYLRPVSEYRLFAESAGLRWREGRLITPISRALCFENPEGN